MILKTKERQDAREAGLCFCPCVRKGGGMFGTNRSLYLVDKLSGQLAEQLKGLKHPTNHWDTN